MKFENNLPIAKRIFNNILKLGFFKIITFLLSLVFVRISIDFVGPNNYGVYSLYWSYFLILFSIDFGLLNGLRNDLVIFKNEYEKSSNLISITFFYLLFLLFALVFIFIIVLYLVNDSLISKNFHFFTLLFFVPLILANRIILPLNFAVHKPYLNSAINAGQFLISILIIISISEIKINSTFILLFIVLSSHLIILFIFNYSQGIYKRIFQNLNLSLKEGIKRVLQNLYFQLAQLSGVLLFQINLIMIYLFSSKSDLNSYSIIFQYFNISYLLYFAIITPFWSEITDSFNNKTIKLLKLIKWISSIAFISFFGIVFLFFARNLFFELVTGVDPNNFNILHLILVSIYIWSLSILVSSLQILNGLKKLKSQFYFSLLFISFSFGIVKFSGFNSLSHILILNSFLNICLYLVLMLTIFKINK